MTVAVSDSRISYSVSGLGPYTIPFMFLSNDDLLVYNDNDPLDLTSDYTVSGESDPNGGSLQLVSALAGSLVIINNPAIDQLTDYPEFGKFSAESHERALDKLTIIAQRLGDAISRSLKFADSFSGTPNIEVAPEDGKLLGWSGSQLVNTSPTAVGANSIGSVEINGVDAVGIRAKVSAAASGANSDITSLGGLTASMSFRNKVRNADMRVAQRGVTFVAPISGAYTLDGWNVNHSSDAVVDIKQTADAPTAAQAGVYVTKCLHADVTTADAAIAAGQFYIIQHPIEGQDAAVFGFGQAGTRYVTLSFWHRHTKTGTYCLAVVNQSGSRSYVAEYTQSVTNTWEKATITLPVDTTGTWLYDVNVGLVLRFTVAAGSTYQTAANTWSAGNYFATANQVNGLDNAANDFKIDLIQIESGDTATPFEQRPYAQELAICQRYLPAFSVGSSGTVASGFWTSTTSSQYVIPLPVTSRVAPTGVTASAAGDFTCNNPNVGNPVATAIGFVNAGPTAAIISATVASGGGVAGIASYLYGNNGNARLLLTGCEL